jgi:hypothetical protein
MNMAYITFQGTHEAERVSRLEHSNVPLIISTTTSTIQDGSGSSSGLGGCVDDQSTTIVFPGPLIVKLAETLARRNHRLSSQQQHQQQAPQPHHQSILGHQSTPCGGLVTLLAPSATSPSVVHPTTPYLHQNIGGQQTLVVPQHSQPQGGYQSSADQHHHHQSAASGILASPSQQQPYFMQRPMPTAQPTATSSNMYSNTANQQSHTVVYVAQQPSVPFPTPQYCAPSAAMAHPPEANGPQWISSGAALPSPLPGGQTQTAFSVTPWSEGPNQRPLWHQQQPSSMQHQQHVYEHPLDAPSPPYLLGGGGGYGHPFHLQRDTILLTGQNPQQPIYAQQQQQQQPPMFPAVHSYPATQLLHHQHHQPDVNYQSTMPQQPSLPLQHTAYQLPYPQQQQQQQHAFAMHHSNQSWVGQPPTAVQPQHQHVYWTATNTS